jgi:hypothetical protein
MKNQQIEVVKEINYFGVTLESSGGWCKQKAQQKVKGIQSLVATDKCLTRIPDMGVRLLENVYEMVCESRMMYGVEKWVLEEEWKEIDKILVRMCKKSWDFRDLLQMVWLNWSWEETVGGVR